VDPGANKEAWNHINSERWEPHTFDILDYFVNKNANILDIGSWSGVISLYLGKNANKIHALDPDPVCFEELKKNIELNPKFSEKIIPHPLAISNNENVVHLSARKKYGQSSSSILSRKRDLENSIQISTISLLKFIEKEKIKHLDFIKMDIEGAEFNILSKIHEALKNTNYPTFYISFHYNFLNEHIYSQHINSRVLNKILMKLEKLLGLYFFKNKMNTIIRNIFNHLTFYKYIYTTEGNLIDIKSLKKNPSIIKNHDLVFTNTEWKKDNLL